MLKSILLAALVYAINIGLLSAGMTWFAAHMRRSGLAQRQAPGSLRAMRLLYVVMLALLAASLLQAAVWAVVFWSYEGFSTFETAYYFSLVNFATLGYGDMVLNGDLRLLGPLEAINGSLMLGLFASILYTVFARLSEDQHS
ncbi:potassium channel family protein [Chitinilyticum piscinae]|uniref:Two pore domain potassium channel family protein n=1 Tax=Chitinilyticum piscinae TaxID=2866724 RepID=A0A8J7FK67_9NEIS|nr:potassium channel family protein [Chitinilyticum piscinae]MBE9609132.1 two pore domain potassium channel family protein [Chitinilyticum piscinae]